MPSRLGQHADQFPVGAFIDWVNCNQSLERGGLTGVVASRLALRSDPLQRRNALALKLPALLLGPLLERCRARVQPLHECPAEPVDRREQRTWRTFTG
jgi:hypothetical protein